MGLAIGRFFRNVASFIPVVGGVVNGLYTAGKQEKAANAINPVDANYEDNPLLQEQQAMARLSLNGGMAGAGSLRRSIFQNGANATGNVRRNAASGAQALALGAASQAQTNNALAGLQVREAQDYDRKAGVLSSVLGTQGDGTYKDKLRKYLTAKGDKEKLMNAALTNRANAYNSVTDAAAQIAGTLLGGKG